MTIDAWRFIISCELLHKNVIKKKDVLLTCAFQGLWWFCRPAVRFSGTKLRFPIPAASSSISWFYFTCSSPCHSTCLPLADFKTSISFYWKTLKLKDDEFWQPQIHLPKPDPLNHGIERKLMYIKYVYRYIYIYTYILYRSNKYTF